MAAKRKPKTSKQDQIVELLRLRMDREGKYGSYCYLSEKLGITIPSVIYHIKRMKQDGVVWQIVDRAGPEPGIKLANGNK